MYSFNDTPSCAIINRLASSCPLHSDMINLSAEISSVAPHATPELLTANLLLIISRVAGADSPLKAKAELNHMWVELLRLHFDNEELTVEEAQQIAAILMVAIIIIQHESDEMNLIHWQVRDAAFERLTELAGGRYEAAQKLKQVNKLIQGSHDERMRWLIGAPENVRILLRSIDSKLTKANGKANKKGRGGLDNENFIALFDKLSAQQRSKLRQALKKLHQKYLDPETNLPKEEMTLWQMRVMVEAVCKAIGIKNRWKPFEMLWSVKNLKTAQATNDTEAYRAALNDLLVVL